MRVLIQQGFIGYSYNILKYIWNMIDVQLLTLLLNNLLAAARDLEQRRIRGAWDDIPYADIDHLVKSIPRRINKQEPRRIHSLLKLISFVNINFEWNLRHLFIPKQ